MIDISLYMVNASLFVVQVSVDIGSLPEMTNVSLGMVHVYVFMVIGFFRRYNTMFLFGHFRPYAHSTNTRHTKHNTSIYGAHVQAYDTYTYCRSHTIIVQTI
jgi:hypothetical protein